MRRRVIPLLFLLISLTSVGQVVSDTILLQEVKVSAERPVEEAGLNIFRPDSVQIDSYLTDDLSELIKGGSVVFVKSYGRGAEATASFRGSSPTHTQLLWNGMSLNSSMRGSADLSLFPLFFSDELYILHGGSSLIKSSGALGGSINLDNTPDRSGRSFLEGVAGLGSFNSAKGFLRLQLGNLKFQSSTRLFYDSSKNNFRYFNSGIIPGRVEYQQNADYWRRGALQEFYLRNNSNNYSGIRIWVQDGRRNLPQLMSYQGSERLEYRDDLQIRTQLEQKIYHGKTSYQFSSGLSFLRFDYYRATPQFDFVNEDSRSKELGVVNRLRISRRFNDKLYGTSSFSVNYFNVEAVDNLRKAGYGNSRLEGGASLNMHFKPSDLLSAFFLIRSEAYDSSVIPVIPSVGAEWQLLSSFPILFRTNVARNYNKPALNDLYWLPGGNPLLNHEDGITGDLSVIFPFSSGDLSVKTEVTSFLSRISNWIVWQPAANGAYYWEAVNLKDVFSRGVEFQYSAQMKRGDLTIRSGGNYSLTITSDLNAVRDEDRSRGKQLIYIPKHKGMFWVVTEWREYSMKFDLTATGKRFTNSGNDETVYEKVLDPFWIGDISVARKYNFHDISITAKLMVENVFDADYQSVLWRPMPGRSYSLSIAFKILSL